jgi:tetratricopeptide (TPR) repeat protein
LPTLDGADRHGALELDPNEAQAHASLGFVLFNHEWDWEGAERSIQRALALDPNSHQWIYALFLVAAGRYDEAATHYQRAEERNPLSPFLKGQLARAYSCAGRVGDAHRLMLWLEQRPGRWYAPQLYTALGDTGRAIAMVQSACSLGDSTA